MVNPLPLAFLQDKNLEANTPVFLYRIQISENPLEDLFYAGWKEDVTYFRQDDDGSWHSQVYSASAIEHGDIGTNNEMMVDGISVSIANTDRIAESYVREYNGLRGRKITIFLVFLEHLGDYDGHLTHIFYVSGYQADASVVTFQLTSKMNILDVSIPRYSFARSFCQWRYKGLGCYLADGSVPTGFDPDDPDTCNRSLTDCERHHNQKRFGGWPSVPSNKTVIL